MAQSADDLRQAVLGYRRAQARQAPAGYEQTSQWGANLSGVVDQDLMRIYRQRQQDRIDAENADRMARQSAGGGWEPTAMNNFAMPGALEGFQHNDQAAGIDPITGEVVAEPQDVRIVAPATSAYGQGSERLRRGGMSGNQAYSLMALRNQQAQPMPEQNQNWQSLEQSFSPFDVSRADQMKQQELNTTPATLDPLASLKPKPAPKKKKQGTR